MSALIEIVGGGRIFIPAAISLVVVWICRRCFHRSVAHRYSLAAGVCVGFVGGYAMFPQWAEALPTRHWHWLPYIALSAVILGPLGFARGVRFGERWLANGLVAIAASCLLVPLWPSLEATRYWHVASLSLYLFLTATMLPSCVARVPGWVSLGILSTAALTLAVTVFMSLSVQYGQLTAVAAMAIVGASLVGLRSDDPVEIRGLAVVFAFMIGGLGYAWYIEPEPPLVGFLVIPLAPLGIGIGRLLRASPARPAALIIPLISAAVVLVIGAGLVLWTG